MQTRTAVCFLTLLALAGLDRARAQTSGVLVPLIVQDSTGQTVAAVQDLDDNNEASAVLAFERNGRLFALRLYQHERLGGTIFGLPFGGTTVLYTGAGCTGQAFIATPELQNWTPWVGSAPTAANGSTVYIAGTDFQDVNYQSARGVSGNCEATVGTYPDVLPVVDSFDFYADFPPPYTLTTLGGGASAASVPAVSPAGLALLAAVLAASAFWLLRWRGVSSRPAQQ